MPAIESDSSKFPFVYVRFGSAAATDNEVRELIADQRRQLDKRQRFLVLVDASRPAISSSTQRRMYAEWIKESEALARIYNVAMVVVISNPVMRGALQAVLWFTTPPSPIHTCATLEEAVRVSSEIMSREGLDNAMAPHRLLQAKSA